MRRPAGWTVLLLLIVGLHAAAAYLIFGNNRAGPAPARPVSAAVAESNGGMPIQDPEHPCGPVSIALVSHLLQRPVTLAEAGRAVQPDPQGRTSMAELVEALRGLGFGAAGVRLKTAACRLLDVPLIIHRNTSHFSVVVPNRTDHVWLLDPPQPAVYRSLDSLEQIWNGTAIVVTGRPRQLDPILQRLGIEAPAIRPHSSDRL